MTKLQRLRSFSRRIMSEITPGDAAWRGAAFGVLVLVAVIVLAYFATYFVQNFSWQKLPAFPAGFGALLAIGILILLGVTLLAHLPLLYRFALIVFTPFLLLVFAPGDNKQSAIFTIFALLVVSLIGAAISVWRHEGFYPRGQKVTVAAMTIGMVGLIGGLYAVFSEKEPANPQLADYVLQDKTLDLANPGLPGDFEVFMTTYGSGADLRRTEFGAAVGHKSRTVDGSKLIDNWDGLTGWLRTNYWGFDATELPLQARVWYPGGKGPFPLVLIVHGNHSMEDFSDPGYAYLGELLASRGIILASVDENFLNSSISAAVDVVADRPGLREENDARGWLLLQHLAQWRDWNSEKDHPFENKIDLHRVALIGHSRGGEAVAVAAAFNALPRYPDDATLEFDFGFNLRGVIAIAPVDGQYRPRDNGTPIKDVNYFTIHGSMDGDVQSFDGTAQYSRVAFSGDEFRFRSSLYVTGANHGQFNTTWGNMDTSLFRAWALDLGGIMDGEAQRDVARVFFGASLFEGDGALGQDVEQGEVVGDDDDGARVAEQELFDPLDGLDVEVVGRFVEQEDAGLGEEELRQGDAHLPAAGELAAVALQVGVGEAEPLEDGLDLWFHTRGVVVLEP
jgi:dienelactone hydrolase